MKIRINLVDVVLADLKKRERKGDSAYLRGADRVDIGHVEQLHFRVRKGRFEFDVDEPPERGGTGSGPIHSRISWRARHHVCLHSSPG